MPPHFYVDESGDFREPTDAVSVGGPVLAGDVADLRARLENAMPGFPWPLHAAHLNRPVAWAIVATLAPESETATSDTTARQVVAVLERCDNQLLGRARKAMRDGAWPDVKILQALEGTLWAQAPGLMRELSNRVRNGRAYIARVGRSLTDHPGVVMSAEASWGILGTDRAARRTGHDETDRYYAALAAAIGRARDLAHDSGCNRLLATVLTRPVYDPIEDRFRSLQEGDVQVLIDELAPTPCVVDLQPIARWDQSAPPACVFADLCSNVGRFVLQDPLVSLADAETRIADGVGLLLRSGHPARSHLVAVFLPGAAAVDDTNSGALRGGLAHAPVGIRHWAWEQAIEAGRVGR